MRKLGSLFLALSFAFVSSAFGLGIEQADTYNKNSDLQWQWAITSIDNYSWCGNERVLDVGCGDGKITQILAQKTPCGIVVGVDVSGEMIQFASGHFKPIDHRNLLFMQADASNLPFIGQFDLVVSFCTLHWVLEQQKALEHIQKSLVEGGKALLVVPAASSNNLSKQCEKLVRTEKWEPYFPSFTPKRVYFTKEEYENLLVKAGLLPVCIETTLSETVYANKNALMNWLKPLVTFTKHLPDALQKDFLSDLADQMLQIDPPASDGSICIHHLKMEALAVKPLFSSTNSRQDGR